MLTTWGSWCIVNKEKMYCMPNGNNFKDVYKFSTLCKNRPMLNTIQYTCPLDLDIFPLWFKTQYFNITLLSIKNYVMWTFLMAGRVGGIHLFLGRWEKNTFFMPFPCFIKMQIAAYIGKV